MDTIKQTNADFVPPFCVSVCVCAWMKRFAIILNENADGIRPSSNCLWG